MSHGNVNMGNYAIIITQLSFPFQLEVMLHYLEEYFYVPTLAVDPYDFLLGQSGIGKDDCRPLPILVGGTDKHNLYFLHLVGFYHSAGKDFGLAGTFPQQAVEFTQPHPLPFVLVQDCFHLVSHAYDRQMLPECGQNHRKTKPAVHQDVVCPYFGIDRTFDHCFKAICRYCHGFKLPFVAIAPFTPFLIDPLQSFLFIGGKAEGKIQRQKTQKLQLVEA